MQGFPCRCGHSRLCQFHIHISCLLFWPRAISAEGANTPAPITSAVNRCFTPDLLGPDWRYLLGPPSSEEPAKILRPSARVTLRALASLLPSLARYPSTVTVSPGLREFRVQPRRMSPLGLPSSSSQLVT